MPKILMIDDDPDFSCLVASYFSSQGYEVLLSHSGKEGLALAGKHKPDIIFLDVMMPYMNGTEVLKELQAGEETSDIPVVIMTGSYFDKGMRDLFTQERNCREFLSKPVSLEALQSKVEALLKKR
jgi:CheY-like chemotaxis protein